MVTYRITIQPIRFKKKGDALPNAGGRKSQIITSPMVLLYRVHICTIHRHVVLM